MTDTQVRFLKAIAERLPAERVAEVHLFPPMRQGGAETGVAVIAVEPLRIVESDAAAEAEIVPGDEVAVDAAVEVDVDDEVAVDAAVEADVDDEVAVDAAVEADVNDESPYAPEPVAETPVAAEEAFAADEAELAADAAAVEPAEPIVRHVVYSARYRYTLKGPERGKWEADVVAEADAPLITVERVVRGVRERSGETNEPERLTAAQFHALVAGEAPWTVGRSA